MSRDLTPQAPNPNRPPLVWKDLITVTDPHKLTEWAVRVQTNESGRPRYSAQLGKLRDSKFLQFIAFDVQAFDGLVTVAPIDLMALLPLLVIAQEEVRKDAQRREDKFRGQRGQRHDVAPRSTGRPAPRMDGRDGGRPDRRSKGRNRRDNDQQDW